MLSRFKAATQKRKRNRSYADLSKINSKAFNQEVSKAQSMRVEYSQSNVSSQKSFHHIPLVGPLFLIEDATGARREREQAAEASQLATAG